MNYTVPAIAACMSQVAFRMSGWGLSRVKVTSYPGWYLTARMLSLSAYNTQHFSHWAHKLKLNVKLECSGFIFRTAVLYSGIGLKIRTNIKWEMSSFLQKFNNLYKKGYDYTDNGPIFNRNESLESSFNLELYLAVFAPSADWYTSLQFWYTSLLTLLCFAPSSDWYAFFMECSSTYTSLKIWFINLQWANTSETKVQWQCLKLLILLLCSW